MKLAALLLEHLPDRALALFGMPMRLGIGDAFVEQPGVQLLQRLEAQPRREEALAHQPDLVLDLTLLPARRRRAGHRLDKIMAAHLQRSGDCIGGPCRRRSRPPPSSCCRRCRACRRRGRRRTPGHARRTPSPASRADRPARTSCGCGRAGMCATFTVTVTPLSRTISWLQSNW